MVEALMLVLLGMLVMTLISLALAPVLWARAARVTTEKIQQDGVGPVVLPGAHQGFRIAHRQRHVSREQPESVLEHNQALGGLTGGH